MYIKHARINTLVKQQNININPTIFETISFVHIVNDNISRMQFVTHEKPLNKTVMLLLINY